MAVLERSGTRNRAPLLTRHLVGRSNLARLRLSEPRVSAEHAMISWDGRAWQVQDLGSKNGTTVDGRRLSSGERVVLQRGPEVDHSHAAVITDQHGVLLEVPVDPHTRWAAASPSPAET